ncbi:hypothetical protein SAMN04490243_2518 [Robiginitalea myxolifaciens]|uniref:Cytochrome C and Quinol oxidase polypeptide I n=1 Tax=Robiginitalea myxolifaciens TaxID=400055 RepID=A0A1I6HBJ5_9FLAO|nr:hypothetical protein [Robiginitalea myxolifaciens]SFR51803.1 hypothetical protein SAMN04490243_2518 [Robiginitalea myxolifaciens]
MNHKYAHHIFWALSLLAIVVGAFAGNATVDVNIHDTYFVMEKRYFAYALAVLFMLYGTGYWVIYKAKRYPSKLLFDSHLAITLLLPLLAWIALRMKRDTYPGEDYQQFLRDMDYDQNLIMIAAVLLFITLVGQLLFPVNLIWSLIKGQKHNS